MSDNQTSLQFTTIFVFGTIFQDGLIPCYVKKTLFNTGVIFRVNTGHMEQELFRRCKISEEDAKANSGALIRVRVCFKLTKYLY